MTWELKEKNLKRYPHFDKFLSIENVLSIVNDPERVRSNSFYPFIKYTKGYQPFRNSAEEPGENKKPDKKNRLI